MQETWTLTPDVTPQEAIARLKQQFGGRDGMLTHMLVSLSISGQPADITFHRRKPILDVRVSAKLGAAHLYGLAERLPSLLRGIEFSDGTTVSLKDIWTVHPMPKGGFTQAELDAVDLRQGEERTGPRGETLRKMIRKSYHCKSRAEVDRFLRRYIAS